LAANDNAAVQINVGNVDPATGLYIKGSYKTYALSGYIRSQAESDVALTSLVASSDVADNE